MRDSGLEPSEIIEIRSAINKFIEGRGWMRRHFEEATDDQMDRYHKLEDEFDATWAKFKPRMSDEDIDKFTEMLESDTVAPEKHKHQYEIEQRPEEIKKEPEIEKRPDDLDVDKKKKKTIVVRQIKKPKLGNQPELF